MTSPKAQDTAMMKFTVFPFDFCPQNCTEINCYHSELCTKTCFYFLNKTKKPFFIIYMLQKSITLVIYKLQL